MKVLTLYVGQGEMVAIRHGREAVIVDSHWLNEIEDSLKRQLKSFLDNRRVAGLVLTGFDSDHADPTGVDHILLNFQPSWVMYPKYYKDTDNATEVFAIIRKHVRKRELSSNPLRTISVRLDKLDSRTLPGLSHNFSFVLFSPHIEDMDNSNNCSIVLKLEGIGGDGFSYLVTGDTENSRWERITDLFGNNLRSDVLSAPHHGSKGASNPKMVSLVSPNTVLISAGVDNQYGHPDSQAVRVYQQVAQHVYQTNIYDGVSLLTQREGYDFCTHLTH